MTKGNGWQSALLPAAFAALGILIIAGMYKCGRSTADPQPPALWQRVDTEVGYVSTPQAVAASIVEFDLSMLQPSHAKIWLPLPGDRSIVAVQSRVEPAGSGRFVWRGTIDGETGGSVRLAVIGETLVGDIVTASGQHYAIRTIRSKIAVVEEIDARKFPLEEGPDRPEMRDKPKKPTDLKVGPGTPTTDPKIISRRTDPRTLAERPERRVTVADPARLLAAPLADQSRVASADDIVIKNDPDTMIDLMILYTSGAAEYLAGPDGVEAKILQIISDVNESYIVSSVNQRVQSVHVAPTAYQEAAEINFDRRAIKRAGNGEPEASGLEGLKAKRIDERADIVALLTSVSTKFGNSCGSSIQMQDVVAEHCTEAYIVVPSNCAATNYSFAHELGHVMGADHNDEAITNSPPFVHSRGFIAESASWRTIMASPTAACDTTDCRRIPHWSNPLVTFTESQSGSQGGELTESTGSEAADNARSLNLTRTKVAAFSETCN